MRSSGWTLIQYDWCPYKKGKLGHRDTEHHVNIKTDHGDVSASQGTPRIASKPAEAKEEAWNRSSLTASEGTNPANILILDRSSVLASSTMRESIVIVQATQFVGLCNGKLMQ